VAGYEKLVVVTRRTRLEELVDRFNTKGQARFYIEHAGGDFRDYESEHDAYQRSLERLRRDLDLGVPRQFIDRSLIPTYTFGPLDVVIALGQDGLVANVAKYLDGQPVIGLNPDPAHVPGVLVRHPPQAAADLIADLVRGTARIEERTMARALLDDGQEVLALNEIFVGHATHQSARYTIALGERSERQSSSGVIAATGTGATGWAASINRGLARPLALPGPQEPALAFFVREAWPSTVTGTTLTAGRITAAEHLTITCELGEGGTVFGDGIEADHVAVDWGQRIELGAASRTLRLVG